MLTGFLILHQDYEVLRRDRPDTSTNSHYPKRTLETLFRVQLSRLSAVPPMMFNNSVRPTSPPERMNLRFFPEFVEDLPLQECTKASKRFEKALHWEIVYMLAGTLAADHYWTERITLFPETILSFLRRPMLEGVPGVGWMDGL